jgi:hypothetical protein
MVGKPSFTFIMFQQVQDSIKNLPRTWIGILTSVLPWEIQILLSF